MSPTLKRHLISAGITIISVFIAAFLFVILTFLTNIESLTDLSTGVTAALSAATLAGVRAAAKWALETFFLLRK